MTTDHELSDAFSSFLSAAERAASGDLKCIPGPPGPPGPQGPPGPSPVSWLFEFERDASGFVVRVRARPES